MVSISVKFLFLLIPLLADAQMPFEDCGSDVYLESIAVSGCPSYPCYLKIGTAVKVTTNLSILGTTVNSADLITEVYLEVQSILTRVHVSPDPCAAFRSEKARESCNLETGERLTYEASLNVTGVPPLPGKLYWTIKNQATKRVLVCYKLTVVLTEVDI